MAKRMKACIKCGQMKRLEDFPVRAGAPDGRRNTCRECTNAANRGNYRGKAEAVKARKKRVDALKKNTKITEAASMAMTFSAEKLALLTRILHVVVNCFDIDADVIVSLKTAKKCSK